MNKQVSEIVSELKSKREAIDQAIKALEGVYGKTNGFCAVVKVSTTEKDLERDEYTLRDAVSCVMADGVARDSWEACHELKVLGIKAHRPSVLAELSHKMRKGELQRVAKGIYQKPLSTSNNSSVRS